MKMMDFRSAVMLLSVTGLFGLSSCLNSDDGNDDAEQFEKDQAALDQYIAEKGYTNIKTDTSNFNARYMMITEGTGEAPVYQDIMYLDYEGSLLNGTVFDENDSVYLRLQNDPYASDALILGWLILMPYLKEGGEMLMFLPSYYGYGASAQGSIPANSPLIFKVKMHKVYDQLGYEQALITDYLEEENLEAEVDTVESLRYIITEEGSGEYVQPDDVVNVDYDGKYVAGGQKFLSSTGVNINLSTYPQEGWKLLLPYAKEGSTIVMYIPSKFAYGSSGSVNVAGNTPLIYTVKINEIVED